MTLTSDMIRESNIDHAITMYLRDGETKESVLDKFDGDTIKTIQFLRDREFSKFDKKPSHAKKEEPKKPAKAVKQPAKKEEKNVSAKQKPKPSQNELF
jgi:hypothetical protein